MSKRKTYYGYSVEDAGKPFTIHPDILRGGTTYRRTAKPTAESRRRVDEALDGQQSRVSDGGKKKD